MKGRRSAFPVNLTVFLVSGCVLFSALIYLGYRLTRLDLFRIRQVVCKDKLPLDFSYLEGSNIFGVDLRKESRRLELLYPGYSKIRLIKVFPDRIFVDFIERVPLAYVKLQRYFCIDEDQVLFDPPKQPLERELPLILGLERRVYNPSAGGRVNLREMGFAVSLIKTAARGSVLKSYPIKTINVPGLSNASFSIADGLEIRISQDRMDEKMDILNSLLAQEKDRLADIRYIDLRFKEPVIKLKSAD